MSNLKDAYRHTQSVRIPATKSELLMRLRERAKPAPQQHLTPNGPETQTVAHQVNAQTEDRIARLRASLNSAQENLHSGTRYATHHGRAVGEFSRCR